MEFPWRAGVALALAFAYALASPHASSAGPSLRSNSPRAAADSGRVVWFAEKRFGENVQTPGADSVAWERLAADGSPFERAAAMRALARRSLALGDTVRADTLLAHFAVSNSPWAWRACEQRASIARAKRDDARAARLLDAAVRDAWPDADRAQWIAMRAEVALATGDSADAEVLARQTVRVYPSTGAAARGIRLLEALAAAHADSIGPVDLQLSATSEALRGMRSSAIGRWRRALARAGAADKHKVALELADLLLTARMPLAARTAAETAYARASDETGRARARLLQARALRAAGTVDSSLALYADLGAHAPTANLRAVAWWEYAREAQDRSRFAEARRGFVRVAQAGDRRSDDARFLNGLMYYAAGDRDSALTVWRAQSGEASRFWYAIALRGSDRARSDSLLRELAAKPGYAFYRAAARDTLGEYGWPGTVMEAAEPEGLAGRALAAAIGMPYVGLGEDAVYLLGRMNANDARVLGGAELSSAEWLGCARTAYSMGEVALGTRLAERAFSVAPGDSAQWSVVPWAYPPAFAEEVVAAETLGVERALTWALVRQESRFEPKARSTSDALGLAQLKLATAGDVARALREREPTDSTLFTPGPSVRYGAKYFAMMLARFAGSPPVALVAYNAGPNAMRKDWRDVLARGGDALFCELGTNADSQDYARRITGYRQAYRVFAPREDR
ncbi:MAG: transglycosylase SLT domain-containing protein [Candidatus Eisenbacteria bacterium]|nr:transglycosylase SLT domain-containing protein [Candidatus Eisenbacteria bacterium]